MSALDSFREEVRSWLDQNCPDNMRTPKDGGMRKPATPQEVTAWCGKLQEQGYTCPTWPKEYGGGSFDKEQAAIIQAEMARIGTMNPAVSFGTMMLGPVLLEFASHEQKVEHLVPITRGEIRWCQGYSEPGSGSDLASLQTRAVRDGDHYVINGQKIWTTMAHLSDWMFCLVRTDAEAAKHQGISFILFDLKSPGVTVKPIKLISGQSQFCEVFFEDVRALAKNLVGKENEGWTIAKRLLQYERNMLSGLGGGGLGGGRGRGRRGGADADARAKRGNAGPAMIAEGARRYLGTVGGGSTGRLADAGLRDELSQAELDQMAFSLTMRRANEEAKTSGPSAASSMFKLYMSEMGKRRSELMIRVMGYQALGWEGDTFSQQELNTTRSWLRSKGSSIEGGTSEIQKNVIAKRVLELPTTG
ncbi:MAG: acyl-CoA dehydrogenase family protein [Myxococcales bacterium]|nr:acyl-CoA dehydrogenase family protein [Myxococcales bacterium]